MTADPEVLHICPECGELASGPCEMCARLRQEAVMTVARMLPPGAFPGELRAEGPDTPIGARFRQLLAEEWHRERLARMCEKLPRVEAQPEGRADRWSRSVRELAMGVAGWLGFAVLDALSWAVVGAAAWLCVGVYAVLRGAR